jgi:hypothetical protein
MLRFFLDYLEFFDYFLVKKRSNLQNYASKNEPRCVFIYVQISKISIFDSFEEIGRINQSNSFQGFMFQGFMFQGFMFQGFMFQGFMFQGF